MAEMASVGLAGFEASGRTTLATHLEVEHGFTLFDAQSYLDWRFLHAYDRPVKTLEERADYYAACQRTSGEGFIGRAALSLSETRNASRLVVAGVPTMEDWDVIKQGSERSVLAALHATPKARRIRRNLGHGEIVADDTYELNEGFAIRDMIYKDRDVSLSMWHERRPRDRALLLDRLSQTLITMCGLNPEKPVVKQG